MRRKNTKICIGKRKFSLWKEEIERLSELAKSQPQSAYIAFTKGYKSKFAYFMPTIDSFEDYVDRIQEAIDDLLLPTLFGISESNEVRLLVTQRLKRDWVCQI